MSQCCWAPSQLGDGISHTVLAVVWSFLVTSRKWEIPWEEGLYIWVMSGHFAAGGENVFASVHTCRNSVWTYLQAFLEERDNLLSWRFQPQSKQPIQKYTLSETNIAPGWNTFFVPFQVRRIFNGFGLLVSGRVNRQRLSEVMKPTCQVWFSSQTAAIFGQQEGISSLSKCSINFAVIHLSHDKKKSGWSMFGGFLHGFHPYTVKLCIGFLNF